LESKNLTLIGPMTYKFLVIDDEEITSSLTAEVIRHSISGSEVLTAKTNEQALQVLSGFVPNLITTDINHPGGNGFEFLSRLRSDPKTAFVPVIAISGSGGSEQQELAQYRHGFDAVIPKPWQPGQLISAITRLLRLRADPDILLIHLGQETPAHDYKEAVDLSTKAGRAALAKDVMAMANLGGGKIIIGVAEPLPGEFVPRGVSESLLSSLETTHLNRAVNEFLDPPVPIGVRRVRDGHQTFVFLEIPAATNSLVLVKRQNDEAGIYPGRIYTRTSAAESAEVRTSSELRDLLKRLQR